jgi:hypothetical protein
MKKLLLKRAIPNEKWEVILEYFDHEYRIFNTSSLYREKGWHKLAYPQHMKRFSVTPDEICWPDGGCVGADYLYERSRPLGQTELERQSLRLSYKNQAPTLEDRQHDVYHVYLAPFSNKLFSVGESIGGGVTENGWGRELSLQDLLSWQGWKQHFEMAGCQWAIPIVESSANDPERLRDMLVTKACERNGLPDK